MKYTEELLWILDKPGMAVYEMDEKFLENIAFVHSLGLKCDRVGWSRLDLASPRAEEILHAIEAFCQDHGWIARGWTTRKFAENESKWYSIRFADAKEGFFAGRQEVPDESGEPVAVYTINAYRELSVSPKECGEYKLIPDRVRTACILSGIDGVDFCWARDKGKYEAPQYFHIYPHHSVSHLAKNHRFCFSTGEFRKSEPLQARKMQGLVHYPVCLKCFAS